MRKLFFALVLLFVLRLTGSAQTPPSQETLNKQMYALLLAYPKGFEPIKGEETDSDWGITDFACTQKLDGTVTTEVWRDDNYESEGLNFRCVVGEQLSLEEAKALYGKWQVLLRNLAPGGAKMKEESSKKETAYVQWESVYFWADAGSIAKEYLSFRPRLVMDRQAGESFRVELNIYFRK